MAKVITVTVRITTSGDGFNHTDTFVVTNNAGATATYFPSLSAGTTFLGPPGGGNGLIVVPPNSRSGGIPTNTGVSKTLVGNAGDVGVALNPTAPILASSNLIGLRYGAAEAAAVIYY